MSDIKIWHNPRCSKSRQGLEYLREKVNNFEIFEYMKEKIDPHELAKIIEMSDQPLENFIRTNEPEYKELGLKGRKLTVQEFADIAAQHPRILQRPIVIKGNKAVLARPVDKIDEIL